MERSGARRPNATALWSSNVQHEEQALFCCSPADALSTHMGIPCVQVYAALVGGVSQTASALHCPRFLLPDARQLATTSCSVSGSAVSKQV
jgi:hypothetical protein